jgi:hypothetical protein
VKINAYVKAVMIPIRFMVPAPLPVRVHFGDVVIDLPAMFAVMADIAVDLGTIRFQSAMAIIAPIFIGSSRPAENK